VCDCGEQGIWPPADIALELGLGLDLDNLSSHAGKVETGTCSKTCVIPPTYLDHLTSKISWLNFCDFVIATHDRGVRDLTSVLPRQPRKLFTIYWHGGTEFWVRAKVTFDIHDFS